MARLFTNTAVSNLLFVRTVGVNLLFTGAPVMKQVSTSAFIMMQSLTDAAAVSLLCPLSRATVPEGGIVQQGPWPCPLSRATVPEGGNDQQGPAGSMRKWPLPPTASLAPAPPCMKLQALSADDCTGCAPAPAGLRGHERLTR